MYTFLSSLSDSIETSTVANYLLRQFESSPIVMDEYFSALILRLTDEQNKLENAISLETRSNLTEDLAHADAEFDQQFKYLKALVHAHQLSSDPERKEAAKHIERVIELVNPNLHRLAYEYEITTVNILLNDLANEDAVLSIAKLGSVADELIILRTKADALDALLQVRTEQAALKERTTPSYIQRKVVRDLINDELIPYVGVMQKVRVDDFGIIARKIEAFVSEININIKTRTSKPSDHTPEPEPEVDTDQEQ